MKEVFGAEPVNSELLHAKNKLSSSFFKRGIFIGLFSGIAYGFYSAFLTLGMSTGIWADWYGPNTVLPALAITYMLAALGSAVNDTLSAIWAIIIAALKGSLVTFSEQLKLNQVE